MVRILTVSSHRQKNTLQEVLSTDTLFDVVASVSSLQEALLIMENTYVDLVLMYNLSNRTNSKKKLLEIQQQNPDIIILIFPLLKKQKTPLISPEITKIIDKNVDSETFKSTNQVQEEETAFILDTPDQSLNPPTADVQKSSNSLPYHITPRERKILDLILKEYTNEEIAKMLFISRRTVEAHKRNLLSKTNSKNLVGLVLFAVKNNLADS